MKEETNGATTRRLGSGTDKETGDDGMHSMQGAAAENERVSSEDAGESKNYSATTLVWIVRFAIIVYLALMWYRLLEDEEFRLHWLHAMTRLSQSLARLFGLWALNFEQAYNDFVATLH
jgi:hypothetical protein